MYPVEIGYLKEPTVDYVEAAAQAVFDVHLNVSRVGRSWPDDGRRLIRLAWVPFSNRRVTSSYS